MNNIEISVIIPVYNGEKYLGRCLQSLIRQTFKKFEIIIINDGSQDKTENVIAEYMNISPVLMRQFFQKNAGQAAARNYGLEKATGKYIAFVDSDDYIERSYLEQLYNAAEKNESDVVVCGYQQVDENGKVLRRVSACKKEQMPYGPAGMFVVWGKLFRCSFLIEENLRFQEKGKIFEDVPYSIAAKYLGKNPIAIQYIGYYYVLRNGSTMNSGTVKSNRFPYEKMTEAIEQVVERTSGDKRARFEFEILYFFAGFLFRYCRKANKEDINKIISYVMKILKKYFPYYYKNKFIGLKKNKEQTLVEYFAVAIFALMCRIKLIRPFAICVTRF